MNTTSGSIFDILISKAHVQYEDSLHNKKELCTGMKNNLVYSQFAAEIAAEKVLSEFSIPEDKAILCKVDNANWKLIISMDDINFK